MKKIGSLIIAVALIFSLTACGNAGESVHNLSSSFESNAQDSQLETSDANADENGNSDVQIPSSESEANAGKILVAYFSWAENAILTDGVDAVTSPSVIPPGNVQQLAGWVQQETGGDLFSIQVNDPYPSDWDDCLARANQERRNDARPELTRNVENLDQYDAIFLGYPNWWYGVPMALLTFLDQNDLSGKRVYLFCSHGTGGLASSVEQISEAAPSALISEDIFDCYEEDASSSQADIQRWVSELGY